MSLESHARTAPEKFAIVCPASGLTRTYRQLNDRSNQLARYLRAHGLKRGDHLALFVENHPAFFEVVWACLRSGYYVTPINRYLPAGEAGYIVDNCDAVALIASSALEASEELGRLSSRCRIKLAIGGAIAGFENYNEVLSSVPVGPIDDESVGSFMLYSSGTTGKPKGILRPLPENPVEQGNPGIQTTAEMWSFSKQTVYLSPAPLYHSAPAGYTAAVLQAGGTVVVMDKFDAEQALLLIERFGVTHSMWVPTMFVRMLKLPPEVRTKYDTSSLRCAIHAAAPCPVNVKQAMIDWWGPVIEEFYSSTEMAGFARISSQEWLEHPGSVGRSTAAPFHICDDEGRELPAGEPGTIYGDVPGASTFSYHKDEGKTVGMSHPKHLDWRTVGDVGYLDADGYLYLTDRKSFMIISGGVNIYPQQVEDALALHPKVADVAVIGVPNEELGEEVKAVVEPAPGVAPTPELGKEIREFVREKLGWQLTPRTVDFTDALPRLPTGKLYKRALREKYWPQG